MHRTTSLVLAAAAAAALAACGPGATTRHGTRTPKTTTANWIEPKTPASPTVASQPGFENDLPNPDPMVTGSGTAYESDVGEPRWRNNPGSYDDGVRPKRTEAPSNQNAIQRNPSIPPTTTGTEQ